MNDSLGLLHCGRKIICAEAARVHLRIATPALFEFHDYSWQCNGCGRLHDCNDYYESDGYTIMIFPKDGS